MSEKKTELKKIVDVEAEILPSFSRTEHEAWFDGNIHHYKTLAAMVAATLKSTLDGHGISYVDIPFREKGKKSFLKKIEDKKKKKNYSPSDMTDLAGIRVITLIESDIQKVSDLIHQLFNVHKEDSVNKTESLGEDKVGYRSVHFVCDIGESREDLPEWRFLKDRCFEIQVRTALMHAWAEIEHDRGYKLGGQLPSNLTRRFSLLSGLLESADLEFNRLTVEIEDYSKSLEININKNETLHQELTTIGIKLLVNNIFKNIEYRTSDDKTISEFINEFLTLHVNNLDLLKPMLLAIKNHISKIEPQSEISILRTSLIYNDMESYINKIWKTGIKRWGTIPEGIAKILIEKNKYFKDFLTDNDILVM